jgi:hypothetical protein
VFTAWRADPKQRRRLAAALVTDVARTRQIATKVCTLERRLMRADRRLLYGR